MDPRQIAEAILSKNAKGNGADDDDSLELETAAGNIIAAHKSGNSTELASSLKEFISLCSNREG